MKNDYLKTAHTFFTGRLSFSYFLRLSCYNFQTALTRSIKLYFLNNSHSCSIPVRNNCPLKIFKSYGFFAMFFLKNVNEKSTEKIWAKTFHVLKLEVTATTLLKFTSHQTCYVVLLIHMYVTLIKSRRN